MAGTLVHFELPVADTERASAFFSGLFGWSYEPYGEGYQFVAGSPSGGLFTAPEGEHAPLVYFQVDDADAALARVVELGGSAEEIQDMPGIGRYVHCRDDQQTRFSLFEPASAQG
jgi:uncharacterized protein